MTTTRCLSSRELIKPESVTHVLRQKCHPCPGLHTRAQASEDERSDDAHGMRKQEVIAQKPLSNGNT